MGIFRALGGGLIAIAFAPVTGGGSLLAAGLAGATVANVAGWVSDEMDKDEARAEGRKDGFKDGFKAGETEAAKKFAEYCRQSDSMKLGAFALGWYAMNVDGNKAREQINAIANWIGSPDSSIHSNYAKSEMQKIMETNPSFYTIKSNYLSRLSKEQLSSIDGFINEVMRADGRYAPEEKKFYENEWLPFFRNV